jgi:hypothetical protein
MIYELRVYRLVPGRMQALVNRFRDHTLAIWERHGIQQVGFWTTDVGRSSNELTYILAWKSLVEREEKWRAFGGDPAWHKVKQESERDGPIVDTISSQLLTPTDFSALQ